MKGGSGLVHMAGGCGPEDYEVGKENGIMAFNTVQESAAQFIGNLLARLFGSRNQKILKRTAPLVAEINELEPEEVSIVVDLDRGTGGGPTYRVTPISQTRNFADRIKAYKLGELWINYLHELGE